MIVFLHSLLKGYTTGGKSMNGINENSVNVNRENKIVHVLRNLKYKNGDYSNILLKYTLIKIDGYQLN